MKGCLASSIKFILFATNLIIFILSLAVFGVSIWAIVDAPSFLDLFDLAKQALDNAGIQVGDMSLDLYSTAAYLLIVAAAVAAVISFLGCCGAQRESKCMLGIYFIIMLLLFILCIVGAVLGYKTDLEADIKSPLIKALKEYKDDPKTDAEKAYKTAWNKAQEEFLCCGVEDVKDWAGTNFTIGYSKPEGCCRINRDGEEMNPDEVQACREAKANPESTVYYFGGCWNVFMEKINNNVNIVIGVAIGTIVLMFLNMLFSFGMCMMVD